MTYASGGLITAGDYNGFVGTSPSSTANTINTIWAVGNGQYGYGQTPLSQVSTTGLVTATQWASAINTLNSIKTHQTGTGTGIGAPTSGSLIAYLSNFSSSLNTAYSSAASFNSQGSTTTGSTFSPNFTVANTAAAQTWTFTRTMTFASADQARYFFNSGGQLNFVTIGATNGDSTNRSGDWVTLIATNLGSISAIRGTTNGGRSGSNGTVNTNSTNVGYWNASTGTIIQKITSATASYTGDYIQVSLRTNGVQGTNADVGNIVYLDFTVFSASKTAPVFNESINVTWNHRIDVVYPETTNLSNSWGTVTIT
jgi:hypothetical protein